MNSVEKVRELLEELRDAKPESEDDALKIAMLRTVLPMAVTVLPEQPDELDDLLAKGAEWAMSLRSDDAPPIALLEARRLPPATFEPAEPTS